MAEQVTRDQKAPGSIPAWIQWDLASKYRGDLKFDLVWILNGQNSLGCKWSGFRMGSEIQKPNHLKSGQMAAILLKIIWNADKKHQDFEWYCFWMVGTIAIAKAWSFENRYIWNPTFKKSGFQMFPGFKWLDFRPQMYMTYLFHISILLSPFLRYLPLLSSLGLWPWAGKRAR